MNSKGYFPIVQKSSVAPILTTGIFANLNRIASRPKLRRRTLNKSKELDGVSLKNNLNTFELTTVIDLVWLQDRDSYQWMALEPNRDQFDTYMV